MGWLKSVLTWGEHVIAVIALMTVLSVALVFLLGGGVWRQLPDSIEVLNGRKRAVREAEYQRLLALENEIRQRTSKEFSDRVAGQAWLDEQEKYESRAMQYDKEREVLRVISAVLARREAGAKRQEVELAEREQQLAARERLALDAARDANFRKALQLYQGMAPELVAEDFQKKWLAGGEDKQEVVRLLRGLPSRVSAEVIEAIADSVTRVAIMKEVNGS